MGKNEVLATYSDLSITVGNAATIADLRSGGTLTVRASSIKWWNHERYDQGEGSTDPGFDLVSDGKMDVSGAASPAESGPAYQPVVANVAGDITVPSGWLSLAKLQIPPGTTLADRVVTLSVDPISPIPTLISKPISATGYSITNPASTLAGAVPRETRQAEATAPALDPGDRAELEQLRISIKQDSEVLRDRLRGIDVGMLLSLSDERDIRRILAGAMVYYNDYPGDKWATGEKPEPLDYRVSPPRLPGAAVREFVATMKQLPHVSAREHQLDLITIRTAIATAWNAYGKLDDPEGFRAFVESHAAEHKDALTYMNTLRNLFEQMLPRQGQSGRGLGLTPHEAGLSRQAFVLSLGIPDITAERIEKAILVPSPARAR
jgi:hypothetical protein